MTLQTSSGIMPAKFDIFREYSGMMPTIHILELCQKDRFKRQIFIDAVEDVVERSLSKHKEPSFTELPESEQKLIISKLVQALDDRAEWFINSTSCGDLVGQAFQYNISANIDDKNQFYDELNRVANQEFSTHINNYLISMYNERKPKSENMRRREWAEQLLERVRPL